MHSFSVTIEHFENSDLWGHHFVVPEAVAESLLSENNRRVICTINQTHRQSCALMPDKGRHFILLNKQTMRKLRLLPGDRVEVTLISDTSRYGMDMPEELAAFLQQDSDFDTLFHALTPGKQRNLIHMVASVKNTESRIRKAMAISEHLRETGGAIDFKALMETIKKYNRLR